MVTALTMFALQVGRSRSISKEKGKEIIHGLQQIPHLIEEYLEDVGPIMEAVELVKNAKSVFFLGRGISAPVAKEGALKLMEVAYIPCLAYPAGEMKHGPIALVDNAMAIVALAPKDPLYDKVVNNVKEVKARDGRVLSVLTEGDTQLAVDVDHALYIPDAPEHILPLLITVPLQMLAYHIALLRDRDVDQPRNLAKSVTVE